MAYMWLHVNLWNFPFHKKHAYLQKLLIGKLQKLLFGETSDWRVTEREKKNTQTREDLLVKKMICQSKIQGHSLL